MRQQIRFGLAGLALILALGGCRDRVAGPAWRNPTAAEVAAFKAEAQGYAPPGYQPPGAYSASADFDGDGAPDKALVKLNAAGDRFAVFVERSSGGEALQLPFDAPVAELPRYELHIVEPGDMLTACGKGMGDDDNCRPRLWLRYPALAVYQIEGVGPIYFWDFDHFEEEWLSD